MNRINIIALGVHDMARSVKFYRDLGFQSNETSECPQVIFFNTAGTKFELYPIQGIAADINEDNPPQIAEGFTGITLAYNVRTEQEVRGLNLLEKQVRSLPRNRSRSSGAAITLISPILMAITGKLRMARTLGNSTNRIC